MAMRDVVKERRTRGHFDGGEELVPRANVIPGGHVGLAFLRNRERQVAALLALCLRIEEATRRPSHEGHTNHGECERTAAARGQACDHLGSPALRHGRISNGIR